MYIFMNKLYKFDDNLKKINIILIEMKVFQAIYNVIMRCTVLRGNLIYMNLFIIIIIEFCGVHIAKI